MNSSKLNYPGSQSATGNHKPPLYNKHDLYKKLVNSNVSIIASFRDVLMNFLRGKKGVKVVIDFREITTSVWELLLYDIDNTGTTKEIVHNQLLYAVDDDKRNKAEGGKVGVFGLGYKQFFTKVVPVIEEIDNNGGISVLTHRVGENNDKCYSLEGVNPGNEDISNVKCADLNSVGESNLEFEDDLVPTENFLAIKIPGINYDGVFDFSSKQNTALEVMANMVATYFVKALDDKVLSFYFRKTPLKGDKEKIDVTEGAKLIDKYGNFKSYCELPKEEFVLSKEHKYVGRYLESTSLTPTIKDDARNNNYRIFGHIPEIGLQHNDEWEGFVMDATDGVGVILGSFNRERADGIPYSIMFLESPIANLGADTSKSTVILPSTRVYNTKRAKTEGVCEPITGLDGKQYRPNTKPSVVCSAFKKFAQECNPKLKVKETNRRDVGRRILMGDIPCHDEQLKTPALSGGMIREYLEIHGMDKDSDLSKIAFPKELELLNGRVKLDLGIQNGVLQVAVEWKIQEKDVDFQQCYTEIEGWKHKYGTYPTRFVIACDSIAEDFPMEPDDNFGEHIKSVVEDLKSIYSKENIEFRLCDTRYFTLNKPYKYFKSRKKTS